MSFLGKIKALLKGQTAHRPMFYDTNLESELMEKGYFTCPLLSPEEVAQCLKVQEETDSSIEAGKYNTLEVTNFNHRKQVHDGLNNVLHKKWQDTFIDYRCIGYNFAVKKATNGEKFHAHVDDIHADESKHISVNVWIPLVDVNEENGALYMVKGSHLLDMPIRGIGLPFPFEREIKLIESSARPIELKAGTAIFFHAKMIHGSPRNKSNVNRPAIIAGLIPQEATPIIYYRHEEISNKEVELFETPEDFYLKMEIGKRPDFAKSLGVFDYRPKKYNTKSVIQLLNN